MIVRGKLPRIGKMLWEHGLSLQALTHTLIGSQAGCTDLWKVRSLRWKCENIDFERWRGRWRWRVGLAGVAGVVNCKKGAKNLPLEPSEMIYCFWPCLNPQKNQFSIKQTVFRLTIRASQPGTLCLFITQLRWWRGAEFDESRGHSWFIQATAVCHVVRWWP